MMKYHCSLVLEGVCLGNWLGFIDGQFINEGYLASDVSFDQRPSTLANNSFFNPICLFLCGLASSGIAADVCDISPAEN